jgi:hypothetical protein
LLQERTDLRLIIEDGKITAFPSALLELEDLSALQEEIHKYVQAGGNAAVDAAAAEAAAAGVSSIRYVNVIKLVERLVREGKYASVQIPTVQKVFYRESKLPHPYHAIELQGERGHHVLGTDGTLYTAEGKVVQHFLGL